VLLTNLCLLLVGYQRVLAPRRMLVAPWSSSSPRSAELIDESRLSRRVFSASACRPAARHPPLPSLEKYKLLPSPLSFCRPKLHLPSDGAPCLFISLSLCALTLRSIARTSAAWLVLQAAGVIYYYTNFNSKLTIKVNAGSNYQLG
jgi:hypothetical protein